MAEVYAGPLSRWFSKGDEAEAFRLRAGVEQWREDLRSSVAEKVSEQLQWDEASTCDARFDLDASGWMLSLMCEGHNHNIQLLMHTQPSAKYKFDLVRAACNIVLLLAKDSATLENVLDPLELRTLAFVLDFLVEE